jgi:hypothetical protein
MTPSVVRRLIGYDPQTERVAFKEEIPEEVMLRVISLLKLEDGDPQAFLAYPIDHALAHDIMGMIDKRNFESLDFFVQTFQRNENLALAR